MGEIVYRILIFLTLLTSAYLKAQESQPGSVLSAQDGRFVFGQISAFRMDQYMLDTKTGRLWRLRSITNEMVILAPISYQLHDYKQIVYTPLSEAEELEAIYELRINTYVNSILDEMKKRSKQNNPISK